MIDEVYANQLDAKIMLVNMTHFGDWNSLLSFPWARYLFNDGLAIFMIWFSLCFPIEQVWKPYLHHSLIHEITQEEFEEHAEKAKTLPESTTNENKLKLYGLFKQATVGPVDTSK